MQLSAQELFTFNELIIIVSTCVLGVYIVLSTGVVIAVMGSDIAFLLYFSTSILAWSWRCKTNRGPSHGIDSLFDTKSIVIIGDEVVVMALQVHWVWSNNLAFCQLLADVLSFLGFHLSNLLFIPLAKVGVDGLRIPPVFLISGFLHPLHLLLVHVWGVRSQTWPTRMQLLLIWGTNCDVDNNNDCQGQQQFLHTTNLAL